MCSYFCVEMENYQGDLTDIFRASGGSFTQSLPDATIQSSWEFLPDPITNLSSTSPAAALDDMRTDNCGDPFSNRPDPLLHELNVAGSTYFSPASTTSFDKTGSSSNINNNNNNLCGGAHSDGGSISNNFLGHHQEISSGSTPCNMFSRIQISPGNINPVKLPVSPCDSPVMAASSPGGFNTSAMVSSDMINASKSNGRLIDNTGPVQILSPRNLGIKRRNSQAKKVVCIPAPATANSRPSGEIVPSDLWAWRKYGQKPIKGSPYPRGYYRCSSSKGCSARKQVERSRTDPNTLVITYTSEHNHPWPTERNALVGSTRSQPPKTNPTKRSNYAGSSRKAPSSNVANNAKEEQKESSNGTTTLSPNILSPINNSSGVGGSSSGAVKEEFEDMEKQMEMDDGCDDQISTDHHQGIPQSYRPAIPADASSDDFFADLGEIEPDPDLDLLSSQGFIGGCHGNNDHHDQHKEGKTTIDPFSIFDWSNSTDHHHNNAASFGHQEASKRGL